MTSRAHRRISSLAILALVLLIAQVGALAHGYSHLNSKADPGSAGTTAGQICTECLSFTPLLSAAGAPAALGFASFLDASEIADAPIVSSPGRRPVYAFRARAPPRLV